MKDNEIVRLQSTHHTVDFNETEHGERFFRVFDNVCRRNMVAAACGFNDYNTPIVSLQVIDDFVNCAERVFPSLWRQLCELRGVVGHRTKRDKLNIPRKKRQVLLQLFLLKRMRNFRSLKWWSLIQGIGYNGWGVGRTAINAIKSFGTVCSSRTRDECVDTLFSKLVERQTALFSKEEAITFVIDNYGETLQLKHQRGEHSASRLSGTHEIAIKVWPYTNTKFDDIKID